MSGVFRYASAAMAIRAVKFGVHGAENNVKIRSNAISNTIVLAYKGMRHVFSNIRTMLAYANVACADICVHKNMF